MAGGLGAGPQTIGSFYGFNMGDAGSAGSAQAPQQDTTDPLGLYGFGAGRDVSGFDINAVGSPPAATGGAEGDAPLGGGSGFFDSYASQMAYLRHQQDMINANNVALANTNLYNVGLAGMSPFPLGPVVNNTATPNVATTTGSQHNTNLAAFTTPTPAPTTFMPRNIVTSAGIIPPGTPAMAWGL